MSECGGCSYLGQCSLPCPFEVVNQERENIVLEDSNEEENNQCTVG